MDLQRPRRIYDLFSQTAERYRDKTAVIYLGTRYSYGKLREMADAFAEGLSSLGIESGQRVMIYLPNSIQWVVAFLGIQKMGGICVPITPIYTPNDIRYIANDSDCQAIVCADTNFGYVKAIQSDTRLRHVIISGMADLLPGWKKIFGHLLNVRPKGKVALDQGTVTLKNLLRENRRKSAAAESSDGNPIAEILYTGGTTQFPKGVPISHDLFLLSADEQIRVSDVLFPADENIVLANAPLFHILGQTCGLATLLVGGTLMLLPRVNLDAMLEGIQRFKVTTMIGVPALYRMILEHERLDQYDLRSVRYWFSAGDVLPLEAGKRWQESFGIPILQGYGATETCGGVAMSHPDMQAPTRNVGRILASKTVKIVDPETLSPMAPGTPGELIVSSPHMVKEYINKPEETANSFIKLDDMIWYRTADIMSMDESGNLFFVDRTVDTIKHKGYRVSASEIEAVLQEHPAVVDACVIGLPDDRVGQRIKAYVVLKEDVKGITGYDLIKWCRKIMVGYKIPQHIEFRDMLPKSKVGKLLRREIREEEKRRIESSFES